MLTWRSSQNADSVGAEAGKEARAEGSLIKGIVQDPKGAVKKAEST